MKKAIVILAILLGVACVGILLAYEMGYASAIESLASPPPKNGAILEGSTGGDSKLTVTASDYEDCVVSVKNVSKKTVVSFYVRKGKTVTVKVPDTRLYVYFATGDSDMWLGYSEKLMFGKDTSYTKTNGYEDFYNYEWTYELVKDEAGNFDPVHTTAEDFF